MELLKTGAYLVNGTEIIEDTPEAQARLQAVAGPDAPSKEEAAKGTIPLIPTSGSKPEYPVMVATFSQDRERRAFSIWAFCNHCFGKVYESVIFFKRR